MPLPESVTELTAVFLDEVEQRMPGRVTGLFLHGSLCWGEFFPRSDVDFVAMWDELPEAGDLEELEAAHHATRVRIPVPTFDGFHCLASDLAAAPTVFGTRPAFYEGKFEAAGSIDINPVTWHELAERPVVVQGRVPPVHTDLTALLEFTRTNLDTYWRSSAEQVAGAGPEASQHSQSLPGSGRARPPHVRPARLADRGWHPVLIRLTRDSVSPADTKSRPKRATQVA